MQVKKSKTKTTRKKKKEEEDEEGGIRKGPWKAEEDEVLLRHVSKHGPRDWSSIRSNGLLLRTGKSCRLRWVNKLRPNLKKLVSISSLFELKSLCFLCLICFNLHYYTIVDANSQWRKKEW